MDIKENIILDRYTVLSDSKVCVLHYNNRVGIPNVRYIFDNETLELKSVELLNEN